MRPPSDLSRTLLDAVSSLGSGTMETSVSVFSFSVLHQLDPAVPAVGHPHAPSGILK